MTFCTGGGVRTPTAYRCLPRLAYRLTVRPEYYSTLAPNESLYCVLCQIKVRVLVQLTLTKILKIVATRWRILRLKMHHNRFRRAYSAPPDPLAGFGGLLLRGGEGRGGKGNMSTPQHKFLVAPLGASAIWFISH